MSALVTWIPVVAMMGTVLVVPAVAPANPGCDGDFEKCPRDILWDYFLTVPVVGCVAVTLALCFWAFKMRKAGSRLSSTEQLIMLWHLTNGTWWSLGCDVMSGLFAVMPLLNNTYLLIDSKHTLGPAFSDPRVNLDVVYLTELTVHVPLSLLVFYLYVKQDAARLVIEPLLGGVQIVGTIAYYLPEAISGGHHWPYQFPVIWSLGIGAGLVWIAVPLLLLCRSVQMSRTWVVPSNTDKSK